MPFNLSTKTFDRVKKIHCVLLDIPVFSTQVVVSQARPNPKARVGSGLQDYTGWWSLIYFRRHVMYYILACIPNNYYTP